MNKPVPITLFFPDHYDEGWPRLTQPSSAPSLTFNASRPLFGTPWEGDYNRGRHYTSVYLGADDDPIDHRIACGFIERNINLDAGLCIELTDDLIQKRLEAIAKANDEEIEYYYGPDIPFESQIDMIRDDFPVLVWTGDNAMDLYNSVQHIQRTGFVP